MATNVFNALRPAALELRNETGRDFDMAMSDGNIIVTENQQKLFTLLTSGELMASRADIVGKASERWREFAASAVKAKLAQQESTE